MTPQHLTLSVSPKGKVHFVIVAQVYFRAQSDRGLVSLCQMAEFPFIVVEKKWNKTFRPITCARCKARLWEVEHG